MLFICLFIYQVLCFKKQYLVLLTYRIYFLSDTSLQVNGFYIRGKIIVPSALTKTVYYDAVSESRKRDYKACNKDNIRFVFYNEEFDLFFFLRCHGILL